MNYSSGLLGVFKAIGLALTLTLGVAMSACAGFLGGDSWQEEVLLHDGQKIIVERSQTYGDQGNVVRSGACNDTTLVAPQRTQQDGGWTPTLANSGGPVTIGAAIYLVAGYACKQSVSGQFDCKNRCSHVGASWRRYQSVRSCLGRPGVAANETNFRSAA